MNKYFQKITASTPYKSIRHFLEIKPYLDGTPYWVSAALVGVVAVVYSAAFTFCIDIANKIYDLNPHYLFISSPIFFFLSVWVVHKWSPAAAGTGVPTVIGALALDYVVDQKKINYLLNMQVVLVVVVSSLLCVLGAGSLGREGPMVHIAACIFYLIGRQFARLRPTEDHRSWIIAGGAAGVSAAFNAPLAGVVFVLEELAHQHFHRFKNVVISGAIIAGVASQWLSGRYLYFGYPKLNPVPISSVFWALLVGLACGVAAYPFNRILKIDWHDITKRYLKSRLFFAAFSGLLIAILVNFVNRDIIGGGTAVVKDILFNGQPASWSLIFGRIFGTTISHLSGAAGGFLAPALALGAAIGSKIATVFSYPNPNLLVLAGMSAFLSAIVRAPFTAFVVVMEMTDRHSAIFPLMIASLVGYAVARSLVDNERINFI